MQACKLYSVYDVKIFRSLLEYKSKHVIAKSVTFKLASLASTDKSCIYTGFQHVKVDIVDTFQRGLHII